MLHFRYLRNTAAIGCMLLGTGSIWAAGSQAHRSVADARILADIPSSAQAVVIIHDMAGLDKKVAALTQKLKIPVLPPSLRHIEKELDLPRGITAHGTAAIVMIPGATATGSTHTVMILPAKDPASVIAAMNFSTGKDGLAHGQSASGESIYAMSGRGCIMVSNDHGALLRFKSVSKAMAPMRSESEQSLADQSDVYFLLNMPSILTRIEQLMAKTHSTATGTKAGHAEELKSIAKKVALRILKDTQSALIGLRITPAAVTLSMVSNAKAGSQVAQALACLRPLPAKPLMGLPEIKPWAEIAASNFDGAQTAGLINKWAEDLPASATHDQKQIAEIRDSLTLFAQCIKPLSQSASVMGISSKPKEFLTPSAYMVSSKTPAASAALMQRLFVKQWHWISHLQFGMGTSVKYKIAVSPRKVTIGSVPFTSITISPILSGTQTPEAGAMQMEEQLMGAASQKYLIGSNETQVVIGGNCGNHFLAAAVKASANGSDTLDTKPRIAAAAKHIPAGSTIVEYLDLSPLFAALGQRIEAMANMNSPIVKMPATEPMSISVAASKNTLTGQWRMPMKNLEQLSMRVHALLPLLLMMEMQSMQGNQAGQAGVGQPQ